jgi:phage terminase small subunit
VDDPTTKPLNHRERLFVAALLADREMNQTNAALAAGYSPRTAKGMGSEVANRPHVRAEIELAIAMRESVAAVTAERVLREVDTVSLSCVSHYRISDAGDLELTEDAPPDAMRAVASVKRRTRTDKDGSVTREVEFRLWDKPGTLRLSMQHRGMLIEKHEVKLPPGSGVLAVPVPPAADQWGAMAAAQQDALAGTKA